MDAIWFFIGLAALGWIVLGPILFFAHSSRLSELSGELHKLRREVDKLKSRLSANPAPAAPATQQPSEVPAAESPVPHPAPHAAQLPAAPQDPESIPHLVVPPAEVEVVPPEEASAPDVPVLKPVTRKHGESQFPKPHASGTLSGEPASARLSERLKSLSDSTHSAPGSNAGSAPTEPLTGAKGTRSFEELVASQWLSWVGAVAVMIGAGYFLKYAIEEQWLGPTGRVALGILGGLVTFAGAAFAMKKDYRVLAEGLAGAAMGILYFSLFAAFRWYDLMPQAAAYGGMILVTAAGLTYAGIFNSLATAVLAMLGGFLTPLMLSKGGGTVSALFGYILILDLGVLGLATFRSWGKLHLLNFFGTLLMWLAWFANGYRTDDLGITVIWITIFGVVFSMLGMWRHFIRREATSNPDTVLMLLNPIAYFGALYFLTKAGYSDYHGLFAILVAAYYLALGAFGYLRNPGQTQAVVTLVGIGLSFVTLAVPLQLSGHWIVIAWTVESLLLIEIGLRYEKPGFRLTGFLLLTIVQVHMILYAGGTLSGPRTFSTGFVRRMWEDPVSVSPARSALGGVINGRSMSFAVNAIVLAILAWEYRRREKTDYLARSEAGYERLGIRSGVPDASRISALLIPMVPVIVLVMGLLETFVHGVQVGWTVATHLSVLPIWLSLFALATLMAFRRMMDVSTLGALSKFLYGLTGCLFLLFLFTRFPDWSSDAEALWGWTIWNPRGLGFLSALTATLVGAIQFSRTGPDEYEGKPIGSALTLAVPIVLLGMCLTETFAFGQRHSWIWMTQLIQVLTWMAVFSVGTLIAGRRLGDSRSLNRLAGLFAAATMLLVLLGSLTGFGDIVTQGRTVTEATYARVVFNPRALGLCIGSLAFVLGLWGHVRSLHRDENLLSAFKVAIPLSIAALALLECYAFGRRDQWFWANYVSATGIVLAPLLVPTRLAGVRLDWEPRWFFSMSQLFYILLTAVLFVLFMGTLLTWGEFRKSLSSYWLIPFFNPRGFAFLLTIAAGLVGRKLIPPRSGSEQVSPQIPTLEGLPLAWFSYAATFLMFTIEVYAFGKQREWGTATSLAVTGTWTALAVATIVGGIVIRSAHVRMCALGVFALTTAKVFLYDVWYLDTKIRTVAFMGLGVALMLTSFLYRRYRDRIKDWIKPLSLLVFCGLLMGPEVVAADEADVDLSTQLTHRFPVPPVPSTISDPYDREFVRFPVTAEIYAASQRQLDDLRLLTVDEDGVSTQIPYVLITPEDEVGEVNRALDILSQANLNNQTEVVLDARSLTAAVESLNLTVSCSDLQYARPVELYGSNEREGDWRLLVNTAYLVDRRRDQLRMVDSTIRCPSSRFRYYKLVVDHRGGAPLAIVSVAAHLVRRQIAPRITYSAVVENLVRTDRKVTQCRLKLAGPVPVDHLEFHITGAKEFHRAADLAVVQDSGLSPLTSLQLFHLNGVTPGYTSTGHFREQPIQEFQLIIQNGDDQPLTVRTARAIGIERSIVVPVKSLAGKSVAIYVGGRVTAPRYDLSRISQIPKVEQMLALAITAGEKNPSFREIIPRKPWAEEHKTLVWILVSGGVVILSGVAFQLLKAVAKADRPLTNPEDASGTPAG